MCVYDNMEAIVSVCYRRTRRPLLETSYWLTCYNRWKYVVVTVVCLEHLTFDPTE